MSQDSIARNSEKSTSSKAAPAGLADGAHDNDPKSLKVRQKAERLIADDLFDQAFDLLNTIPQVADVRNLKGVCLIRKNAPERAVQLYRTYLLISGTTSLRTDVDQTHIINYATALLMLGRPSGCLEVLNNLESATHPAVVRLNNAIDDWSRSLGLWARFNWWLGKLEPIPCVVPINFEPGEYVSTIPAVTADQPAGSGAQTSTQTVV